MINGEVEQFAARISSLVNRAGYTTEEKESGACLNGLYTLMEKLYVAPDE